VHDTFPLPDLTWEPTRPYWDGAARGELVLPRCGSCGRLIWYPRPHCGGDDLRWQPVAGDGALFAWTVVRHAFLAPFRDQLPFVAALVALAEDPRVRIVTRIVDCEPDDLQPGMAVHVVFRKLRFTGVDGEVTAPLFAPGVSPSGSSTG
jgi:uncharacterized protein